jgi:hypothetical protein
MLDFRVGHHLFVIIGPRYQGVLEEQQVNEINNLVKAGLLIALTLSASPGKEPDGF